MGGEILSAVGELASKAGKYLPKIFDGELSNIGVKSGEAAIRGTGAYGDMLVDSVKAWQDRSAQMSGQYYADMLRKLKPVMKDPSVTKDIATHWQNYGNLPNGPLKEAITAAKIHRLNMYNNLMQAGVKVGPMVEDDFPRMYPRDWFEGANREQALSRLQKQGMSLRQATSVLDEIGGRGSRAHNYETPRKGDLPGYRRDLGVLFEDIDKASKRLNYVKLFGADDEILDVMHTGIKSQGGRPASELATRYLDAIMKQGKYYTPTKKWEQGLASLEVASKLGLAVLSHTSQPLNLAVYGGRLRPMVKAMGELVSEMVENGNVESAEDFSLRSGATWQESMRRYKELYGTEVSPLGSKLLHATGFVSFDKYRRIYASVTGKHLAMDLFEELQSGVRPNVARQKLSQMGIDVSQAEKRGSLSPDDLLQAAKRTSDVTQFVFDANQLPMAWKSSPTARVVMQFKQYFYTQAKFIKDFALKPAVEYLSTGGARGEIKPLVYMAMLFPTFGEVTSDIRELARKGTLEERPQFPLERLIDNASHAGAFGIWQDLFYNIASPSDKPIWHFVAGPAISDIVDTLRLPYTKQPVGEELLRRVPVVGPYAAYAKHESSRKRPRKQGFLEGGGITRFIENLGSQ